MQPGAVNLFAPGRGSKLEIVDEDDVNKRVIDSRYSVDL